MNYDSFKYSLKYRMLPSISKYTILERSLLNAVSDSDVILLSLKLNIRNRNIFSNGVPSILHNLLLSNYKEKKYNKNLDKYREKRRIF